LDNIQGETRFNHVEIRYAGGNNNPRGAVVATASSPRFNHLSVTDSAWYPISVDIKSSPHMESIVLQRNSPSDSVEIRGSSLDTMGETVWYPWLDVNSTPLERVINEKIVVGNDATLTLEPGTILKFGEKAGMEVRGVLMASQAIFTSMHDEKYLNGSGRGEVAEPVWLGISFYGRRFSRLDNVVIRYAQVAVRLEDATPSIVNSVIENSWTAALSTDFISSPEINSLTLSGNAINGILLRENQLPDGNTYWRIIGANDNQVVRVIMDNLLVGPESRLIIEPGTVVKFGQQGGLVIDGQLFAGQQDAEKVVFTSLADSSLGGTTHNSWVQPNRGAWAGISVNPNETNARLSLLGVDIRFAVIGLHLTNMFNWEYQDLTIANSQMFGISCDLSSLYLSEDTRIILVNNGLETITCPTFDRRVDD
jgi:hypothetical protein